MSYLWFIKVFVSKNLISLKKSALRRLVIQLVKIDSLLIIFVGVNKNSMIRNAKVLMYTKENIPYIDDNLEYWLCLFLLFYKHAKTVKYTFCV